MEAATGLVRNFLGGLGANYPRRVVMAGSGAFVGKALLIALAVFFPTTVLPNLNENIPLYFFVGIALGCVFFGQLGARDSVVVRTRDFEYVLDAAGVTDAQRESTLIVSSSTSSKLPSTI